MLYKQKAFSPEYWLPADSRLSKNVKSLGGSQTTHYLYVIGVGNQQTIDDRPSTTAVYYYKNPISDILVY